MEYKNKITDFFIKWIIVSMGVMAGLLAFIDMFEIKVNSVVIVFVIVFFSAVFLLLSSSKGKIKDVILIVFAILIILFIIFNIKALVNGLYSVANSILDVYKFYYEKESVNKYDLEKCKGLFTTVKQFNTLFFGIISIAYSYILVLATSKKVYMEIHILLSVVFLIPGMILGEFPGLFVVSMMMIYYILCVTFNRNNRVYFLRFLYVVILCVILIGFLYFTMTPSKYYSSGKYKKNKERIDNIIDDFSLKTIISELSDMLLSGELYKNKAVGGISEGKLGEFETVKFKNIEMLQVNIFPTGDSIYLKGYACNEYKKNKWEVLSKTNKNKYEKSEDKYLLEPANIKTVSGLDIYRLYVKYLGDKTGYRYVPYMSDLAADSYYKDLYPKQKSESESYYYRYAACSEDMYQSINEDVYDENFEFYESVSMEIPDNIRELFDEILIDAVYYDGTNQGLYDTIQYVKSYLRKNARYTLSPGKLKKGDDFVVDFLTEKKEGYCTAFASAAVLMFRYLGVPARYAEGYLITNNDYRDKDVMTDGYVKVAVMDSFAHAWPEIYIKGVGFMPVEVTPAYTNDNVNGNTEYETDVEQNKKGNEEIESTSDSNNGGMETKVTNDTDILETSEKKQDKGDIKNDINSDNYGENAHIDSGYSLIIVVIIILVIFLIVLSILFYKMIEKQKKSRYETENLRENINILYDIFKKCMFKIGIEFYMDSGVAKISVQVNERIETALKKEKLKECKYITAIDVEEIFEIMLKSKYSSENIKLSEEEYKKVRQYVEEFKKSLQYLKNKV